MDFLVMLGPPGAGKGTLCRLLIERVGALHVSTGDAIRKEMENPLSDFGQRARPYMDRGDYVPDGMALELFENLLREAAPDTRWIFDGFPRTVPQAEWFARWVTPERGRILGCVFLQLDVDTAVARMAHREICQVCGAVYHRVNRPPQCEGRCDECGGTLVRRDDDTPGKIASRMKRFQERTRPLVDWFAERDQLWSFDAALDPEMIAEELLPEIPTWQNPS